MALRFWGLNEAIAPGRVILREREFLSHHWSSRAIATPLEGDRSATGILFLHLNPTGTVCQGLELEPLACRPAKLKSK
ncbi:hypothetical protein NG796_17830 [Laspinema sp. A4]|uniref:hypothetical protein n=1 Tax=Laspinema sp. D2d TaxID=2953686 RepID=UPI0021BB24E8|nr:hypothetical protein [Laspinema sp. D2d]MCT7985136.1 hypothetical protein [Laspinema sp. D2d]